jgi:hypothetical protein
MNVHRWRKLEGSDPDRYELIQKIRTLQKRLIKKTEEVVEKDLLIKDKDKLLADLKSVLSRQPVCTCVWIWMMAYFIMFIITTLRGIMESSFHMSYYNVCLW